MRIKYLSPLYTAACFAAVAIVSFGSAAGVKAASRYDVVVGTYTWPEALQACRTNGGHLATIDSETEFFEITGKLQSRDDWAGKVFYIGGKRDINSRDYYWVDANGNPYGTSLLSTDNWAFEYWGPGEPTYEYGGVQEYVCSIFKYQGVWILNDEPENMVAQAPDYYGLTGYICEYDDPTGDPLYVGNTSSSGAVSPGSVSGGGTIYPEDGPYTNPPAGSTAGSSEGSSFGNYDSVFDDAMNRHNNCDAMEPYNGITYSVLDIDGDGVNEIIFDQITNKHSRLFWIYRLNNGSWQYMGEISHDADTGNLLGYQNGLVYRECYKGSIILYQSLWDGSKFVTTTLMSGQYDRNGDPPSMDDLAGQGYYNASSVTGKAPAFRDVTDRSLLE